MSTLLLVRHGQACAFTDEPDRLSELGREQALALGGYWARRGLRFDAVFHGSLRRQRETCDAVTEAYRAAEVRFPDPIVVDGLNEYGAQDLVGVIAPGLAARDRSFAALWDAWQSARGGPDQNRRFQLMFETLVSRWIEGDIDAPGLEPWLDFRQRVEVTIEGIRNRSGRGQRQVAFTSGGVIGVAMQTCLGAPPQTALALNWRVRNASITSFLYSGARISLDGFNETPHLAAKPDMVTFR